jgi:dienelactone hydrolase
MISKLSNSALILQIFAFCTFTASCFAGDVPLPLIPINYCEQVVRIPVLSQPSMTREKLPGFSEYDLIDSSELAKPSMTLEVTVFRPPGNGPFPVLVFNHGKGTTNRDAYKQERARPWTIVREFVMRGYVVVAPNRKGFSGSSGSYILRNCDVTADGLRQADDVRATVAYMLKQPYVDGSRIIISGGSQGGLITIAYGKHPDKGVRGLINFSGGSRQVGCPNWGQNIVNAFANYGHSSSLPSIWIYGENDSFWSTELIQQMFNAYCAAGGQAEFTDTGVFKTDSHSLAGDPDGTSIWWPSVEAFLNRLGFPTKILYRSPEAILPASHFAAIDQVDAVPYLNMKGKNAYREFLKRGKPRIFALSDQGKWSFTIGGDDPLGRAVSECQKKSKHPCKPYAIDDDVVWTGGDPASVSVSTATLSSGTQVPSSNSHRSGSGYASIDDVMAVPYINDRGRDAYRQFLAHPSPRAFVIVKTGAFTTSYGGNNPLDSAMRSCRSHFQNACEPYAVNDTVVWVRP